MTILPFFLAVGPVVVANQRTTVDSYIIKIDNTLLGWDVKASSLIFILEKGHLIDQPSKSRKR
jgi:hypothetical protein